LILERFDLFTAREAAEKLEKPKSEPISSPEKTNGTTINANGKRASPSSASPSSAASASPVPVKKRKHKVSQSVEETDAAYAARLQAEENGRSSRATRGGGTKRKTASTKKREKKPKKKSKNRVGSEDDSDAATGEEKEVKTTGFHVCDGLLHYE
jgi:upstream activation factor subunit UAF30